MEIKLLLKEKDRRILVDNFRTGTLLAQGGAPRGQSAYEQAVEGGYSGTKEEFEQALATGIAEISESIDNVDIVAENIEEVNTVAGSISDVHTVSENIESVVIAATAAQEAKASAMEAATSAASAAANATNAALSASQASESEQASAASAAASIESAATATSQANAASQSALSASSSATSAQTSATNAQKWAEGADSDVAPLGGEHSSKGWANMAKQYAESIGAALKYKGSVSTYSALPSTGQEVGDMWKVLDTGKNYVWTGAEWDDLSGVIDLSAYRTAAQQDIIDSSKQDTLVSGTNIKTVNGNSLLGSGNVDIDALPSQTGQSGKFLTTDGTDASWADVDALPTQTGNQGKYLTTDGSSASWEIPMAGLPMFYATYQPRKLNNASWLRADPYSWHRSDVYVSAYAHLANNISGVTAETETIAGTTITFYRLSDEIKVVLPDQISNLDAIYNATGIGYYFILDTTNKRFKLPRNIYGFTGYRGQAGNYVAPTLPNIKGFIKFDKSEVREATGAFLGSTDTKGNHNMYAANGGTPGAPGGVVNLNASNYNHIYQDGATVQPPAVQTYLYFYVGNTVQNETSVAVAQLTEAVNGKADTDLGNLTASGKNLGSSLGKPNNSRSVLLTIGASGTTYTAPGNGWYMANMKCSGAGGWVNIIVNGSLIHVLNTAPSAGNWVSSLVPVCKGEVVRLEYGNVSSNAGEREFRFYYDVGAE